MSRRTRYWMHGLVALLLMAFVGQAAAADKIKVLLLGGRGHDWKGFHSVISEVLDKTGDFEVKLSDQLDDLKAESINKYDLVLFYGSGGNFTDDAQEQGLDEFVKAGGGLAGVHATDAFKKSDLYWRLFGGRFSGHGGGSFMMRITDKKHPITAPMQDFEISDETYRNTFHPDFKMQSLGHMDRGQEQQSMIWVQDWGKGRVFNTTLGHGRPAWENPALQRLIVRGLYWAVGQEPKDPVGGKSTALFDGKTLDGWQVINCEAEVQDGAILIKAGNGLIQTKQQYADFVLELQWKALAEQRWDSGIYFRYTEVPRGRPWPNRYQTNLLRGMEGNVGSLRGATSKGLIKQGDWNHFKLTVKGTKAALEINGKPAWEADGLQEPKGYISLQAEVPNGGQFLFRDIRLTVLD